MIPIMPTILEHAAFLINQTPSAAAKDAVIMAEAHIAAQRLYKTGAITVGMDIYNIEAEALGCEIRFYDDASIPGILTHPLTLDDSPQLIKFSTKIGRIQLLFDAAGIIKNADSGDVKINIGICGPFSILMELLGYEAAVHAIIDEDPRVFALLDALLAFQKDYCSAITNMGLGVAVFESWASPPLISPDVYRKYAFPYEKALLAHMEELGMTARPLIIGGDTRSILDCILKTGTTLLVSDYNTPLDLYIEKAGGITVRANIDPKQIQRGAWPEITARINEIRSVNYPNLVIGTGVVPYDTPPENLLRIIAML